MSWAALLALLSSVSCPAPKGHAQAAQVNDADRATARELGLRGLEAFDAGNFAAAVDQLSRAIALFDAPTLRLGRARAERAIGRLISAGEDYRAVVRWPAASDEPAAFTTARHEAGDELAALEPRIPRLTITLRGAVAHVTVNGVPWPEPTLDVERPIDPGTYVIEATAQNRTHVRRELQLAEGQHEAVTLDLGASRADALLPRDAAPSAAAPAPSSVQPSPARSSSTPVYVAGGIAIASGIAAIVTGAVYLGQRSDYRDRNRAPDATHAELQRLHDRAETLGWVSTGLAGIALVGAGTSAYLWLSQREHASAQPTAALQATPRAIAVTFAGRF